VTDRAATGTHRAVLSAVLKAGAVASAVLLTTSLLGGVIGAATTLLLGPSEQGQGAYESEQTPTYWGWVATVIQAIPAVVPSAASTNVGAPTVLPRPGSSYVIDPSTAGDPAVVWQFLEGPTTPPSTELEVRFVATLGQPTIIITVYLETQTVIPPRTPGYDLYWDAGTFAPATITVDAMRVTVLACSSLGTCP
jgi:hypothetical protein